MPSRPLPRRLVAWLSRRKIVRRIDENFEKLRNIDHRQNTTFNGVPLKELAKKWDRKSMQFGFRVRAIGPLDYQRKLATRLEGSGPVLAVPFNRLDKSKRVVIKRTDYPSAREVIQIVQDRVDDHNRTFGQVPEYVLRKPFAYALSRNYIAMSRTRAPNVAEVLFTPTKRGEVFFSRMKEHHGVTREDLSYAFDALYRRNRRMTENNTLILGYRNGKFIFMPLIDDL